MKLKLIDYNLIYYNWQKGRKPTIRKVYINEELLRCLSTK
jgi:hypothetical protein